jgi:hypothetical protein
MSSTSASAVVASVSASGRISLKLRDPKTAEGEEHGDHERDVADPVGDEGLLRGDRVLGALEPEPDQQVAGEPHELPAEEEREQVLAQHQHEHGAEEEVEVGEEALVAGVAVHVAQRVDVDQQAHAGDDEQHHGGELVDQQAEGHRQRPHLDPGGHRPDVGRRLGEHLDEHGQREGEAHRRRGDGHPGRALPQGPGDGQHGQEAQEGHDGDQPGDADRARGRLDDLGCDRSAIGCQQARHVSTSTDGGRRHRASRGGRRG